MKNVNHHVIIGNLRLILINQREKKVIQHVMGHKLLEIRLFLA